MLYNDLIKSFGGAKCPLQDEVPVHIQVLVQVRVRARIRADLLHAPAPEVLPIGAVQEAVRVTAAVTVPTDLA